MSGLKRVADRLKGLITLGRVSTSQAGAGANGRLMVDGMVPDEDLRFVQSYGLASRPQAGAEAIIVQLGSNADEAIVIACDDRRYRIALAGGEVALYDDLGSRVLLKRGGEIEVEASTIRLGAGATRAAARFGDVVTVGADWLAWLQAVAGAAGYLVPVPGGVLSPSSLGTIATASAKVVIE